MNGKLTSLLLAGTAAAVMAFSAGAASATSFAGVCPSTLGKPSAGGGGPGSAAGCTIGISVNSSSLTINTGTAPNGDTGLATSGIPGAQLAYESIEDVLVGVVNTGTGTLGGITLNGAGLFGFDGDGIDLYGATGNASDSTGYGGPASFFTNLSGSSGIVNFIGGIAPGASAFFSLEAPTSGGICSDVTQCPHFSGSAPEPASIALLGSGLFSLAGLIRLRRRRQN